MDDLRSYKHPFKSPKTQALCERAYQIATQLGNQARPQQFPAHLQESILRRQAGLQAQLLRTNIDLLRAHQVDTDIDRHSRFEETIANLLVQLDELEYKHGELAA